MVISLAQLSFSCGCLELGFQGRGQETLERGTEGQTGLALGLQGLMFSLFCFSTTPFPNDQA